MNSAMQVNKMNGIGFVVEYLVANPQLGGIAHEIQTVHGLQRSLEKRIEVRR